MKVNNPTVGPIVGYTTFSESRIWFRGQFESNEDSYRRCFGLLRYKKQGEIEFSQPLFNKMSPNFDMTCVLVISKLEEETPYEYQVGWIFSDLELEDLRNLNSTAFVWSEKTYLFKSAQKSNPARDKTTYVVGSCRYLLKTFLGDIFDDRGDKIFKSIVDAHTKDPMNGVLMIGDQIYADDLKFIAPDTKVSQFFERYRSAFSQKNIRNLMSCVPTYMILDDHEIEDNWPSKASREDKLNLYPHAIHAYQIYQCSHSPLFTASQYGRIEGNLQKFWYQFSEGCVDWFVMDCRTERVLSEKSPRMVKSEQLNSLLNWLQDNSGNIKAIVTSVPFAPNLTSDENEDKWGGFIEQRIQILDAINSLKMPRVVFVSGDVHCSFVAKINHKDKPDDPIAYQIVSSSFFWPYPHMQEDDFVDEALDPKNCYTAQITSPIISDDNFVKLSFSPFGFIASFYDRKGKEFKKAKTSIRFNP